VLQLAAPWFQRFSHVRLAQFALLPQQPCLELRAEALKSLSYQELSSVSPVMTSPIFAELNFAKAHTLPMHADTITKIVVSQCGNYLITSARDGSLRVSNSRTGASIRQISAPSQTSKVVDFYVNKASLLIVGAFSDGSVKVFHFQNGRTLHSLSDLSDPPVFCHYMESKATDIVVFQTVNGGAFVWFLDSDQVKTLTAKVTFTACCNINERVATCHQDGTISLWDGFSGRLVCTFRGHTARVNTCAFDEEGKQLVSCSEDHTLRIWGMVSGKLIATLVGHTSGVLSCMYVPGSDSYIASIAHDGSVRVWDEEGHVMASLNDALTVCDRTMAYPLGPREVVLGIQPLKGGERVVVFTNLAVSLWNLAEKAMVMTAPGAWVTMSLTRDQSLLCASDMSGQLHQWVLSKTDLAPFYDNATFIPFADMACCALAGQSIVAGTRSGSVTFFDAISRTEKEVRSLHYGGIRALAASNDGRQLASSDANTVTLWRQPTGERAHSMRCHSAPVTSICFRPDGRLLASGDENGIVCVWDTVSGELLRRLSCNRMRVTRVALSGSAMPCLAVTTMSGEVFLFRAPESATAEWTLTKNLRVHERCINDICFNALGTLFATASSDTTIKVFDLSSALLEEREMCCLQGHTDAVTTVTLNNEQGLAAEALILVSSSNDGTIRMWNPATSTLLSTIPLFLSAGISFTFLAPRLPGKPRALVAGNDTGLFFLSEKEKVADKADK
jgi:WD40 repeat protein